MLRLKPTRGVVALACCAAALVLAAPAAAGTYQVSGKQTIVDENAGTFKMRGGLVGSWTTTSYEELGTSPLYHARGTEEFNGCLDRRSDRSCKGDPSGTLSFTFEYWALFASPDPASLVWGACWHPVVSGTGDFAGAQGVIQMVDTPTSRGVTTRYIGNVTLKGNGARRSARAATAARSTCGLAR
jgi:hypothetical protein